MKEGMPIRGDAEGGDEAEGEAGRKRQDDGDPPCSGMLAMFT